MANTRTPTAEQAEILVAASTGKDIVIIAGAGTGKSTTLKMVCEQAAQAGQRVLYLAFNKSVQVEASKHFPPNTTCKTAHGLAYGPTVTPAIKRRLNGPRVPSWQAAKILGVRKGLQVGEHGLDSSQVTRLAIDTVGRFCRSADAEITGRHVPRQPGLEDFHEQVVHAILPIAQDAWADIIAPNGQLKFEHQYYLKLYQMSHPTLRYDIIMLDEAQDANPVIADIILRQAGNAQLEMVGDTAQAIYGFTGAINAMESFARRPGVIVKSLSQSFRFGPRVAVRANIWLGAMDAPLRITGFDKVVSTVGPVENPDAILCRTNGGAIGQAMAMMAAGRKVHIVGGGGQLALLAKAAVTLKAGTGCTFPELAAFRNWSEVEDYAANDSSGSDLQPFVKLVNDHGPEALLDAINALVSEDRADVIVSTVHKAKGGEWERVLIAADWPEPKDGKDFEVSAEIMKLAYVAVTRAKLELDDSGLAVLYSFLAEQDGGYNEAAAIVDGGLLEDAEAPLNELLGI